LTGLNPIVAVPIYLALGLWVIRSARNAYSHPDTTLQLVFISASEGLDPRR